MATSLEIIILLGLLANKLFEKLKLLGLLGMIIVGVIMGIILVRIFKRYNIRNTINGCRIRGIDPFTSCFIYYNNCSNWCNSY